MLGHGSTHALGLGQLGSDFINDTSVHTGSWGILYCIQPCTFTTLTSGNGNDGNAVMAGTLSAMSLASGMIIYGYFTTITLSSGSLIAYRI